MAAKSRPSAEAEAGQRRDQKFRAAETLYAKQFTAIQKLKSVMPDAYNAQLSQFRAARDLAINAAQAEYTNAVRQMNLNAQTGVMNVPGQAQSPGQVPHMPSLATGGPAQVPSPLDAAAQESEASGGVPPAAYIAVGVLLLGGIGYLAWRA